MPILIVTDGPFAGTDQMIEHLADTFDCRIMTDTQVIESAHLSLNIRRSLLQKTAECQPIPFNRFTNDRERCLSALKKTLADATVSGSCICHGLVGLLIPRHLAVRILVEKDRDARIQWAAAHQALPESDAGAVLDNWQARAEAWVRLLCGRPCDAAVYDLVLPENLTEPARAADLVARQLAAVPHPVQTALEDFKLAAEVEQAVSTLGPGLLADARDGSVTVTIDKKVAMLAKLRQDIIRAVDAIPGVLFVTTRIGRNYYKKN